MTLGMFRKEEIKDRTTYNTSDKDCPVCRQGAYDSIKVAERVKTYKVKNIDGNVTRAIDYRCTNCGQRYSKVN